MLLIHQVLLVGCLLACLLAYTADLGATALSSFWGTEVGRRRERHHLSFGKAFVNGLGVSSNPLV